MLAQTATPLFSLLTFVSLEASSSGRTVANDNDTLLTTTL
jgi:hypothetical protein